MKVDRPYADFIGVQVSDAGSSAPLCALPPGERVSGENGMLHGGALAALLETAAGALVERVVANPGIQVQPVSITVDYVRSAPLVQTYANAEIVRRGDRIVHVDSTAWQDDADRPIAMARLVFSLRHE